MNTLLLHRFAKPLLFVCALLPLLVLAVGAWLGLLGSNPAEVLLQDTGNWTMRFLCLTLAVSPLRQWTDWHALARYRRMLGLYAAFYGLVHLCLYAWLEKGWQFGAMGHDIATRRFILMGLLGVVLMLPLALTSHNRVIKAMGAVRWKRLHKLTYLVTVLGLLHWLRIQEHRSLREWFVYAAIVTVFMLWRLRRLQLVRRARAAQPMPAAGAGLGAGEARSFLTKST
jgi:methionine sulfoxide reductase heme-binding subunit